MAYESNIWPSPPAIARDKIKYFIDMTVFPHHQYEKLILIIYAAPSTGTSGMAIAAGIVGNVLL
jgi:hypothetical protein